MEHPQITGWRVPGNTVLVRNARTMEGLGDHCNVVFERICYGYHLQGRAIVQRMAVQRRAIVLVCVSGGGGVCTPYAPSPHNFPADSNSYPAKTTFALVF
jgi:hypothetical protein